MENSNQPKIQNSKSVLNEDNNTQKSQNKIFKSTYKEAKVNKKKCQLCHYYSTDTKISFSCGEEICGICLSRMLLKDDFKQILIKDKPTLSCPKCKDQQKQISIPDIVKMLSETPTIREKKIKRYCERHKAETQHYCTECKLWLCSECKDQFHKQYFNKHNLQLEEPKQKSKCKSHNKEEELYCLKCKEQACFECFKPNQKHSEHPYITLEDFQKETIATKNSYKYKIYDSFENALNQIQEKFKQSFLNSHKHINKLVERINEILTRIKKEYLNKLNEYNTFIENYFQIIKLCYYNYFSDIKEFEPDIERLNFIKEITRELDDIRFISTYDKKFDDIYCELKQIGINKLFDYDMKFKYHLLNEERKLTAKGKIYSIEEIGEGLIATGGEESIIKIWDVNTGEVKHELKQHTKTIFDLKKSQKGLLISASADCNVILWNFYKSIKIPNHSVVGGDKKEKFDKKGNKSNYEKRFNNYSDNEELSESNSNSNFSNEFKIKNMDVFSQEKSSKKEKENEMDNSSLDNRNNGSELDNSNSDFIEKDLTNIPENHILKGHKAPVFSITILDQDSFCSSSADATIKIWLTEKHQCLMTIELHTKGVGSLLNLGNRFFASSGLDKDIYIWSYEGEKKPEKAISCLKGHTNSVFSLILLKNGQIASGSCDKTIRIWNWETDRIKCKCIKVLLGHNGYIWKLVQMNDKTKFSSCSSDKTIKIWDITTYKCITSINAHSSPITTMCLTNEGKLISAAIDGEIKVWDC